MRYRLTYCSGYDSTYTNKYFESLFDDLNNVNAVGQSAGGGAVSGWTRRGTMCIVALLLFVLYCRPRSLLSRRRMRGRCTRLRRVLLTLLPLLRGYQHR